MQVKSGFCRHDLCLGNLNERLFKGVRGDTERRRAKRQNDRAYRELMDDDASSTRWLPERIASEYYGSTTIKSSTCGSGRSPGT